MLSLNKKQLEKLIEHSEKELPNEACGILAGGLSSDQAGENKKVEKIYKMVNTDSSPASFFMDARQQLKVMKEIRGLGLEMLGIYHSHPDTQAYPSAHDVKLAFYPDASYVIVSLQDKDNPSIRSFKIVNGEISEEQVKII